MSIYKPRAHQTRPAAILGNGPSLRGFNFADELVGFDTFGMNAAYRHWHAIQWYPTYYSCLDAVVGLHHKDAIQRLILEREQNGIQLFLLRRNLVEALGEAGRLPCICNYDALLACDYRPLRGYWYNTGSHTTAWAALLGYRDIVLLGTHGTYVALIPEAGPVNGIVLEITETPISNPNYFFDGYQQKGDRYHVPVKQSTEFPHEDQELGWHMIRPQLDFFDAVVVNATPESKITAFPCCDFAEAISAISRMRAERDSLHPCEISEPAPREAGVFFDTFGFVASLLSGQQGVLLDVGAHHGECSKDFLQRGWQVFAFEPDTENNLVLQKIAEPEPHLIIEARAVSCASGRTYPWCRTPENSALSAMVGFLPNHVQTGFVTTVTLRDYCQEQRVHTVDLLKVSTVGFDLMVLRGFPFEQIRPRCIICEFDDRKSIPLGTDMHDLGSFLLASGYHVFLSEWHPVMGYNLPTQWRRFVPYPAEQTERGSWGHYIAFADKPDMQDLHYAVQAFAQSGLSLPPVGPQSALPMPQLPYTIRY